MDFLEEIKKLEEQGVFICYSYDHYTSGTNVSFSIQFSSTYPDGHRHQTGWYGDNHEFGDVHEAMKTSVLMAKWFLKGNRVQSFFHNVKETVTKKGHKEWMKQRGLEIELGEYLETISPHFKEWGEEVERVMKERDNE